MKTVHEVSSLTGVSIRTLHYYDSIDLLKPTQITQSGYREYDNEALKTLQVILLFRELDFNLKDIKNIISNKNFNKEQALEKQIELLEYQKRHISDLITFARCLQKTGVDNMDFKAFDKSKMKEYAEQAKTLWGNTEEYKEFSKKSKNRTEKQSQDITDGLMNYFCEFGKIKDSMPNSNKAISLVKELQQYISDNYYYCSDDMLINLGHMYIAGGSMTDNIDNAGGRGTAEYVFEAIKYYCTK